MLITFVVSPGPPFVMIRMESNTLNVPVVMVIKIKNNWGDSIGRVILKNFLVPLAWSSIAAEEKTGKLGCVMGYDPAGYDFSCNLYHLSNV